MRTQSIITNEYYHIYNRGVDKRDIFDNKKDIERFIESIIQFNKIETIGSIRNFKKEKTAPKALGTEKRKPLVSIVAYCINPNHFHFILKQLEDGGISKFMQKISAGYTSYFNTKNLRSGSLFQGTFKAHHLNTDTYFNKIIAYVNCNYKVHDIPKEKSHLIRSSDIEYKNNNFTIVDKDEVNFVLEIFGGNKGFENHCKEIVSIIREDRGKQSLLDEDNLPDSALGAVSSL